MIDYGLGVKLTPHINKFLANDWRNNPEIWAWCRQHTLISMESQIKWHEKIENDSTIKMFSIMPSKDSSLSVGVCGFTSIDLISRRAEFSCYINPNEQRKGYARAALKTLFNHGFMDWGFNSIWGETFDSNPAYQLFLDIGMKHEGTRRQFYFKNGQFIDAHLVSVLRSEWKL